MELCGNHSSRRSDLPNPPRRGSRCLPFCMRCLCLSAIACRAQTPASRPEWTPKPELPRTQLAKTPGVPDAPHDLPPGNAQGRLSYPPARRSDVSDTLHGTVVRDPYRWLEAESPEMRAWAEAQDVLARSVLDHLPQRQAFHERLAQLGKPGSLGAPVARGGRLFFTRNAPGAERPAVIVSDSAGERILADSNAWPEHVALQAFFPSPDGRKLVYAESHNNTDESTYRILDVDSTKISEGDTIPLIYDSAAAWDAKSDGFFYRWAPDDPSIPLPDRPGRQEVRFHKLGTSPAADITIRPATGDAHVTEYPSATLDGRWLLVTIQQRVQPSARPCERFDETAGRMGPIVRRDHGNLEWSH